MKLQLPKGTRDFKPEEMIVRNKIVNTLREIFEIYGYPPLETPSIERFDLLSSKDTGGSEILKETFQFKDQGKRDLGLRYDLTVPLSRFVGMNPSMKMPFKRYQIGEVFRDGPVESARYRQFTQCDVDIVGCKEITADAEIIALTSMAFNKLGLDCVIKINNRKLLNDLLKYCKVPKNKLNEVILTIDKLDKFGLEAVIEELKQKKISKNTIENIIKVINIQGLNEDKIAKLKKMINKSEGLKEIEETLTILNLINVGVDFNVSIARGLSYYTGTVIEVFVRDSNVKTSVCAGGRYDKMIGSLLGRGNYPAVGISFGLDRIYDAYIEKNKEIKKSVTQIFIIPIKTLDESLKIAEKLRSNNIKVDIDLLGRNISKNLQYANSLSIPYVLFIGPNEIKKNKVKLRDMKSGEEEFLSIKELISLERL